MEPMVARLAFLDLALMTMLKITKQFLILVGNLLVVELIL